jgi:acyl-coenzyme A thioesterase PaaI-like protein
MKLLGFLRRLKRRFDRPPFKLLEYYPPLFFMGLRIEELSADHRKLRASLPLRWYARNFHGTMFGGHLCAASDPMAALLCAKIFRGVEVWTKSNCVEFVKPARSRIEMLIEIKDSDLAQIHAQLDAQGKAFHSFEFDFRDRSGNVVAHVKNTVYLKRRMPTGAL